MMEKLDYYDILTVIIPGTLLVIWIPICFPALSALVSTVNFPEAFEVIALTALAIFFGQIVQALASMIEPLIYKTWGGRPSDKALTEGLERYLPKDSATRIRGKLVTAVGKDTSDMSLFLFAMQLCTGASVSRVSQFNSLYAYHRSLFVLIVLAIGLLVASVVWGAASLWTLGGQLSVLIAFAMLLVLIWYRTKQRASYYVREVLLTAERVLEERRIAAKE
jgi:hypothetical protein